MSRWDVLEKKVNMLHSPHRINYQMGAPHVGWWMLANVFLSGNRTWIRTQLYQTFGAHYGKGDS